MQMMSNTKKWLLFFAIFFVSINLRPSVTSVGPLLNTIQAQLGVSSTFMSLLTSVPVFCMGLFAPFAVPIQKKLGYRTSINVLILLIGVATAMRYVFDSYTGLIITSFLTGFAIAIISPIINAYIKQTFKEKMAPVIGLYSFAIGGGASLSAGLTGPFYKMTESWSFALAIWGGLSILALFFWSIAVEKRVTTDNVAYVEVQAARNPWTSPLAWIILIYFGLQTALFFSLTAWLPSMAQDQGFSLITAGNVLTVMSIVQLIGNLTISALVAKYPNIIRWLFSLIAFGSIGALILFIPQAWAIWVGAIILGAALSGLFPIGLMLPLQEARSNQEANEWSSMVLSGGFMLSAIIPLLIGVVYDQTNTHLVTKFIFLSLFLFMWLSIVFLKRAKRV